MNHDRQWYPQNNSRHNRNDGHQHPSNPQTTQLTDATANSIQNGRALLGVYPPASATPTNHVSRHISSMTLTAAPTFHRPEYYNNYQSGYPQGNPPPYSEYDNQLRYLATQSSLNDSGYWENTRDNAVRMLNEQMGPSYQYPEPTDWAPSVPSSSFQTRPFANSVFQRTAPSTAYPTPPPGISASSSSLAFALGAPPSQPKHAPPPPKVYQPQDSHVFFEDFLEKKTRQINPPRPSSPVRSDTLRTVTPPPKARTMLPEESPDPLAIQSSHTADFAVTPKKRKSVVEIESPSVKRMQSMKSFTAHSGNQITLPKIPQSKVPLTPSSASKMSVNTTPTAKRIVNLAYVSIPPSPWLTPSSRKGSNFHSRTGKDKVQDTPDDLGGYGSEDDVPLSPTKGRSIHDSVKSSARRTGDRDERGPLEKLTSLIEDIFEAEDALPADIDINDLNHDFFSPLSTDCARPLLSPTIVRKLTKYIGQVARPTKRLRQTTGGVLGTPRAKGRMADVDTQILSRLLKLLDRSVRAGEDIEPFFYHAIHHAPSSTKSSPRKPDAKKNARTKKSDVRSKSQTPKDKDEDEMDTGMQVEEQGTLDLGDADFDKLSRLLDVARDSIVAADCCIALLGSDRLTKQLYSEELITACLNAIKNQLSKILYPFVEASAETGTNLSHNPVLHSIIKNTTSVASGHRRQLGETFQALSSVLPRINNLVNAESVAMSDSIIIQVVYIAIGPFFVVDAGGDGDGKGKKDNLVIKTLGKSAMRGLRLDALSLIRSIFANHEDQRSWIIEEILTSLIKLNDTKQKAGQFRLRDGRSIRTVSALLLQLVQTSAHDVRLEARKIEKVRQNKFALRRQESFSESQPGPPEPFLDETDQEEIRLYGSGLESATKAAKTIIVFLTQRSGKGKATKNSNEAEYRAIFDNLIDDLLTVLFWPEWPAASIILTIASKFMVSFLDDVKTNSQTESNAAKTIALDHLGVIAARIRTSILKVQQETRETASRKALKPLDEIVSNVNIKHLNKFLDAHRDVASHLSKRSSEDQAYDSARELTAAMLGQELAAALKEIHRLIDNPEENEDLNIKDESVILAFGQRLKTALREVWKDSASDVFNIGSQEEVLRVDGISEELGTIQSLRNSFNPILGMILMALDAPAIFMRTKALRALGQIVTSDSTILSTANVRRGIESHLLDSSPAVRDAAVELIGKYMIDSPEVAGDYYQKIADRIADTGLCVRKRVIKLLKSFYGVTDDNSRRIDIATRLVLRMLDEDETVKDLAIKTIEELWFPPLPLASALKARTRTTAPANNSHDKTALLSKVAVIMGTSANFKDRQSPLEDILHKIMADKDGNEASFLDACYAEICEALIDGLVDASDLPGFTVINCIRTIYLLTSAYPSILSGTNASTLLPYLKNASTAEELATSDYLLKIFRVTIPHMPKTAVKFGQELQATLQPMIIKPSAGGVQLLQETVACLCIVVQHLTHDFVRLVNLLKSCNARLQQAIKRPASQELTANDARTLIALVNIVSLLAENCNFDTLRKDHSNLAPDLNNVSQGPITEYIYNSLLTIYEKYINPALRGRLLQCLGLPLRFLFRAQPTLMTLPRSASVMDEIFASPEEDGRGRLLKVIQEFLVSEVSKHSAKEKGTAKTKSKPAEVNMEELVGNTDGFADSGVSSAIVQRYLNHVLDAALSQNIHIQGVAIDVLSFTIKQGLAHPLQSFPVIIALETSPGTAIGNRASVLHAILQGKHASLLNTRYTVSARASFDYQKKVSVDSVRGFRLQPTPIALLQRWYSHVREKRQTRQDFLKSLVKVFQENSSYESTQDDVNYTRYMAENFATFDYKTQEEVFTVIKSLTSVLSTTGMQLLEIISPSHLLTTLHGASQPDAIVPVEPTTDHAMDIVPKEVAASTKEYDKVQLMRTSVIIAMVMLLKAHLKTLYSLSEDKCNKFAIGKKSAIGDKTATRRHEQPISWNRLPFATTPLLTSSDADVQKTRFIEIWNEDGLTAEPEEDEFF